MKIKKIKLKKIKGILIVLLIFFVGFFTGCTNQDSSSNNNSVYYPVFSSIDLNILNSAYENYELLKQNFSYDQARIQLLDILNNETEGVELAELGLDGYTIFITYSDGDFAGVDTFEEDEYLPPAAGLKNPYGYSNDEKISFDTPSTSDKKITPDSKKVLILGPCYYDFNTEPFEESIEYFKAHGWTDDDIVMKVVDKRDHPYGVNFGNLKPEDFFDLQDYGIIIYTGHGATRIYRNFNEDNIYLQFCFITNDTYTKNPDFQKWKDEKKILVFNCSAQWEGDEYVDWYITAIRADVLREKLKPIPNSYMHLSTCFGAYFCDVFNYHGAKWFLSWTDKTNGDIADENMLDLNKLMLENSCLYNAFMDDTVERLIDWPYSEFNMYTGEGKVTTAEYFYFPAWLSLTVTGIPSGTSYIKSTLYDSSNTALGDAQDKVSSSQTQIVCENLKNILAPSTEEVRVEIKAYNSGGQELASGETTVTLDTGENPAQIALTQISGLTIEFFNQDNGQLEVRKCLYQGWFLMIDAKLQTIPNGEILYVWDNIGDSSLGGFGYNKEQHYETSYDDISFYSSGVGTDGTKIPITCNAYLINENGAREFLGSGSAEIEIYYPTQIYELCGNAEGTQGLTIGSGSSWDFYIEGHGKISNQFYARTGDQIRAYCDYPGYMSEGLNYDIYIRLGTLEDPPAQTQLIVSQSEIVEGLNKIVTIEI